jgi:pentatricopeptide repeat protein
VLQQLANESNENKLKIREYEKIVGHLHKLNQPKHVLEWLYNARERFRDTALTSSMCTAAVVAFANTQQCEKALEICAYMNTEKLHLQNIEAYNILLQACNTEKRWDTTVKVFKTMLLANRDISPNSECYYHVLKACDESMNWVDAKFILKLSIIQKFHLDLSTLSANIFALQNFIENEMVQDAREAAHSQSSQNIMGVNLKLNANINSEILEELRSVPSLAPSREFSFQDALSAAAAGGKWAKALEVLQAMQENGVELIQENYISVMIAYINSNTQQGCVQALEIFQRITTELQLAPNLAAYNAALLVCKKDGLWDRALDFLTVMQDNGVCPDEAALESAIVACGRGGQVIRGVWLLAAVKRRGIQLTCKLYAVLIRMCGYRGQYEMGLELLREGVQDAAIATNLDIYSAAIYGCEINRRRELALEVLEMAIRAGAMPAFMLVAPWSVNVRKFSLPMARVVVSYVLDNIRKHAATAPGATMGSLMIITGKGINSETEKEYLYEPKLRVGLQQMLLELKPPLPASVDERNSGVLYVGGEALSRWLATVGRHKK